MKKSKTNAKKLFCCSCKYYDRDSDRCGFNGEPDISKAKIEECGAYERIDGRKRKRNKDETKRE